MVFVITKLTLAANFGSQTKITNFYSIFTPEISGAFRIQAEKSAEKSKTPEGEPNNGRIGALHPDFF
jgi:hypothetical protein